MNPATSSQELDTLIQGFGENEGEYNGAVRDTGSLYVLAEEDLLPLDLISLDRMRRPSYRARQLDSEIEQETPVMGLGLLGVEDRHTLDPLPCDPVMSLTSTMATVTIESRGQVDWGAPFIPRVPHTLRTDAAPASGSGKLRASKQRRHHRRLSRSHPYSPERPLPKPLLTNLPPIEGLLAGEDDLAAAPLSPLVLPATWPSPIGSCRAPARSGTASRSTSIARSRYSSSSPARSVLAHAPMVLPEEPCQASWAVPG
ncbi:hypothetical protein EV715DRAFT_208931 [Schizophyllum commune]